MTNNKDAPIKTSTVSTKLPFNIQTLVTEFITKPSSKTSNKSSGQSENLLLDAKNAVSGLSDTLSTDNQSHNSRRISSKSVKER